MSPPTFTVFLDEVVSSAATSTPSSSYSKNNLHDPPVTATKENVNPLTGLSFDAQPPAKKRKPSSSSALKVKPLPSSSKPVSKSKKLSLSSNGKDKGKKKAVLGSSGNRNAAERVDGLGGSEAEHLRTALGNRRAYDFTVMPLANVTQAYDEGEATRAMARARECAVEDREDVAVGMILEEVTEEVRPAYASFITWCAHARFQNDVEMRDMTSKEATLSVRAAEA